jgi:hypothetical protein
MSKMAEFDAELRNVGIDPETVDLEDVWDCMESHNFYHNKKIDMLGAAKILYKPKTPILEVKKEVKNMYKITVEGCDAETVIKKELTDKQFYLVNEIACEITKKSTYDCMPRMNIKKIIKED